MKKYVTPSLLNVDSCERLNMANTLIDQGVEWIHYDVMDGNFVDNTAISFQEILNIKNNAKKHFKDIHLMVSDPISYVNTFAEVGDILTIHIEAVEDMQEFQRWLEDNYHLYKIGLALKPSTDVHVLDPFLAYISLVLVMSVEPGKGGQKFITSAYEKIEYFKKQRTKHAYTYLIQVDGGINDTTGPMCLKKGADAVVAGTFLVANPTKENIQSILGKYRLK
ncbi:ribulose-phosphate 3-epimerase [Mycoplasmopsis ciconiae]|uniref:Ribulose-phosphate 3-epimerase n=1 Tax=Mycoplasmopsis ciconiae TaxID=561067 RepID=A0ABU7MMD1_9BACT|nr:ribulose-phosphate 3-epimerase [Mycoplasmopsis ciconiae]